MFGCVGMLVAFVINTGEARDEMLSSRWSVKVGKIPGLGRLDFQRLDFQKSASMRFDVLFAC